MQFALKTHQLCLFPNYQAAGHFTMSATRSAIRFVVVSSCYQLHILYEKADKNKNKKDIQKEAFEGPDAWCNAMRSSSGMPSC